VTRSRTITFDIETVATDAATEAVLTAPFDEAAFTPKGGATKPETIARQLEEARAEWETGKLARVDALALSPRTGRIVCAGTSANGSEPIVLRAVQEATESSVLFGAWADILSGALLVSFNGLAFDLAFLVTRSVLLGVRPAGIGPRVAPLFRRYSYAPHFDVRMVLSNWDQRASGTRAEWAAAFGLKPQTLDGSAVGALHRAGDHDAIVKHCSADVSETYHMFTQLAPFYGVEI